MSLRAARFALALALALGVLGGCSRDDGPASWLTEAEHAQLAADEALSGGDVEKARRALADAVAEDAPKGVSEHDVRIVRQDLYYRLATLELASGAPERAAAWADKGLALGEARDVFVANLYIARGRARERLGDALGAGRDYHQAIAVSEALLDQALGTTEGTR